MLLNYVYFNYVFFFFFDHGRKNIPKTDGFYPKKKKDIRQNIPLFLFELIFFFFK